MLIHDVIPINRSKLVVFGRVGVDTSWRSAGESLGLLRARVVDVRQKNGRPEFLNWVAMCRQLIYTEKTLYTHATAWEGGGAGDDQ